MKKIILNKTHYWKLAIDNLVENFLMSKLQGDFKKNENLIKGLEDEIMKQKKAFCGFINNKVG